MSNHATTSRREVAHAVQTLEGVSPLAITSDDKQGLSFSFSAGPGLYQFSAVIDASQFDWEELYFNLYSYHNTGQRTGPWDFSLLANEKDPSKKNPPLVPAYWVTLDQRRLGLWFFQRVSLEDLAHHRFRGHMAFHLDREGEHHVELTPYRPMAIRWSSARLEKDPDDRLGEPSEHLKPAPGNVPAAAWRDPAFWEVQRRRLATTHAQYRRPLHEAFDWVMGLETHEADHLPLLIAAHHLDHRPGALERAIQVIDQTVALPAWGNPNPEGYSHNGDMNAARLLRALATAYHMLDDGAMGTDRRARLLEKVRVQGRTFFELALLNRDYWGGSLLQDHGWRSMFTFATAALHLRGVIPEVRTWVAYALPRIDRALGAMPRDGALPPSSYNSLILYLPEVVACRTTLLALGGNDLYDAGPFHAIVDFVDQVIRDDEPTMLLSCHQSGGVLPMTYGRTFFNQMAAKYHDGRAARLSERLTSNRLNTDTRLRKAFQENAPHEDSLWALFAYDPDILPTPPNRPRPKLAHYPDSGVIHYHDPEQDVTLALQCGPWCGWHADRHATGPCDRIGRPCTGHFTLFHGTTQLLANPDSTYALKTEVRNCLLVDGRGQIGDIGYPMSIPSWRHPGEEIQYARWDGASGTGDVRLDLKPAYPDDLGMAVYTRQLIFHRNRIICVDHLVFDRPRQLCWLFHGRRDWGVALETDLRCRLGDDPSITIEPRTLGAALNAAVHPTQLTYGYSSQFKEFDHVRYETVDQVTAMTAEFVFHWQSRRTSTQGT